MSGKSILRILKHFFISLLFVLFLWVIEALLEYIFLNQNGNTFLLNIFPFHNRYELLTRFFFGSILILTGILILEFYSKLSILQKEESKAAHNLEITLNSIGDAVITTDLQGKVVLMNPVAEMLTGWQQNEAKGLLLKEIFHIVDTGTRKNCENPVDLILRSNEQNDPANQLTLTSKTGKEYQIADSAALITDEKGQKSGAVLIFRDISEDYRMKEKLKEGEERYRDIASANWVWEVDKEARFTYSSNKVQELLGYSHQEMLEKTIFDIMLQENRPEIIKFFEETSKAKSVFTDLENLNKTKDGRIIHVLTSGFPILDNNSDLIGFRGTNKDITDWVEAQTELLYQTEMLKIITNIATRYISVPFSDTSKAMQMAIQEVGEFVRADRAYVFNYDFEKRLLNNTHEWVQEGVSPEIDNLQNIPMEQFPEWVSHHKNRDQVYIPRVTDLPDGNLRDLLMAQEIKSLITIPMFLDAELIGFVGFDSVNSVHEYTDQEVSLLKLLAQVLVNFQHRILSEQALRHSEEKLSALYASMTEMVVFHEMIFNSENEIVDYKIIDCNQAFTDITGISRQDAVGHLASKVYSSTPPPYLDTYAEVVRSGKSQQINVFYQPLEKYFIVSTVPLGKNQFATITSNITNIKEAEEELRHLRNFLSNIINSMPSILVGVDSDGNITQWNDEARRITGVNSTEALGQPLYQAFPRLADEMERVRQAMRSRRPLSYPKRLRQMDNETRYEDLTIFPLVANGVEGAVIRIDDVTEQVRLEEMMVQSEKMLSVGGLAAGMAHEINNPLAGMLQTANVLKNRLNVNRNIPANQQAAIQAGTTMENINQFMEIREIPRMLGAICQSGRRVADIVENMLSFARKGDASFSTHRLDDLLERTLNLATTDYDLKKHYDFKKIKIIREYETNIPGVPCESGKIQQVLLNILRNGAEAMQEMGIETPQFILRTRYNPERKTVSMEIEDNGPGMSEEVRKRVFEPFYTTKPPGIGTGLGLSVSYFIITENHMGEISVESKPGKGSNFIISLPVEGGKNENPG